MMLHSGFRTAKASFLGESGGQPNGGPGAESAPLSFASESAFENEEKQKRDDERVDTGGLGDGTAENHVGSQHTCRFGLAMLMTHFLDSRFSPSVLDTAAAVESDEYYVRMMEAWFFATALAKQWDAAIPYLQQRRLGVWVHNKTIQKACESYRITAGQKAVLRTMKIKAHDHK